MSPFSDSLHGPHLPLMKVYIGTGKMAQSIKCLLGEHEDQNSAPIVQKPAVVAKACSPITGETVGGSPGMLAIQLSPVDMP